MKVTQVDILLERVEMMVPKTIPIVAAEERGRRQPGLKPVELQDLDLPETPRERRGKEKGKRRELENQTKSKMLYARRNEERKKGPLSI